jgi:hypothetical protein
MKQENIIGIIDRAKEYIDQRPREYLFFRVKGNKLSNPKKLCKQIKKVVDYKIEKLEYTIDNLNFSIGQINNDFIHQQFHLKVVLFKQR